MALQFASLSAHYTRSEIQLFVYVLAYIAVAYLASLVAGHAGDFSLLIYPGVMIEIGVPLAVLVLCARMVFIMVRVRPQNLFLCIASDLRDRVFTRQRAIKSLPVVFVLVFFISTYTSMKSMIPVFHDYVWDETFMRPDRFLHFGWHPWQLLEPVWHEPVVTYVINVGYNALVPGGAVGTVLAGLYGRRSVSVDAFPVGIRGLVDARRQCPGFAVRVRGALFLRQFCRWAQSVCGIDAVPASGGSNPSKSGLSIPRRPCSGPT